MLSRSAATTEQIGCLLGESLQGGEVIALCGDLGAGKTVLVKGLASGVGAP
ncbi:MAG: tRNA (adenosine(37)-N6)-threonylcarbamoyltransferase complex ATPase subunit type 1 TsaE, partial [Nitrospira sp.]